MTVQIDPDSTRPPSLTRAPGSRLPPAFSPVLRWKAPLDAEAPVLGRLGGLETRLARSKAEIRAAQALRYQVFYQEGSAQAGARARLTRRDSDRWDRVCDHLLVIDRDGGHGDRQHASGRQALDDPGRIVGTYRFLTGAHARRAGSGFYSQSEFDIASIVDRHAPLHFMELGRSCVLPTWRNKRTVELLWQGCWAYVLNNHVDVMIGCASFEGTDPGRLAEPLSFLFHHAAPPPEWQVRARQGKATCMNLVPAEAINAKKALHALPPLIKGYLRLGAWFASEAVVDRQFATTDVLVILPVSRLNPRYVSYYGADAGRRAAPSASSTRATVQA
ncbi:MAG: GNAT family N-acyltransferase [Pseudomonadota bacterium]|nr:GNAT family N-acyltransferase [Pseudomonadota bacterium]